jgi:glycosyltransferase involved in cell wall biosynthesis
MPPLEATDDNATLAPIRSAEPIQEETVKHVVVVRALLNMTQALSTQGVRITALGMEHQTAVVVPDSVTQYVRVLPCRVARQRTLLSDLRFALDLAHVLSSEKPDILHINALRDLVLAFVVAHLASAGGKRPAIVAMSHSPLIWRRPLCARFAMILIRIFADGFISLSRTHAQQLGSLGMPKGKLSTIPNSYDMDLPFFARICGHSSSTPHTRQQIVYVANICERKAQDILIKAVSVVLQTHPEAHCYLIGGVSSNDVSYSDTLHKLTRRLGIDDHVHFLGPLSYQHVLSIVADSTVVAFPSRAEMMPRAVIEAMALGKPVVASAVDGILDLIKDSGTGMLVTPGDAEQLAQALCKLLDNPVAAEMMGVAAEAQSRKLCSPCIVGRQYRDFYRAVIRSM